ncbi:SPFH domain-containing protein [Pontibacter sp. G13]|uniref:SPFH domain-containing protein n=1 Tax=Pontibacter sp. G13 TaxID=3074898 RepID=UPI00288A333A|nr:SPFH domain-containing protein [Pontibacter sp. G13]WNJ17587.1 SPFH domain-containing protein [Pontibacter sp. G13]
MEIVFGALAAIGGLAFFRSGWVIVKQKQAVVIQRLGKFQRVAPPGFQIKIPFIDTVAGRLSLKVQQLDVKVETKTLDDVFVHLKVSVQYQVLKSKVYDAFYELEDPKTQITSYVFDVVRAEVPKMKLDEVFARKDDIAIAIKSELAEAMENYGYGIVKALVTDIDPDEQVKRSMNRINAAEREKIAAHYEAEADRIKIVAIAQAEAESKKLQGQGIADQRREIAKGLEDSVEALNKVGINSQEASALIVVTQHYDTLQAMGSNSRSNLVLLPNSPSNASDMMNQMITSFSAASMMGEELKHTPKPKLEASQTPRYLEDGE